MRLEKWALIAEIIGGVAIVISLVFLVFEVRQNTAAVQASTYDRLLSDHTQYRMDLATDTEAIEAYLRMNDRAPSGPEELSIQRGRLIWIAGMMLWERLAPIWRRPLIPDARWRGKRRVM